MQRCRCKFLRLWGPVTKVPVTCQAIFFNYFFNINHNFEMEIVFEHQGFCVLCPSTVGDCRQLCAVGVSEAGTAAPPWMPTCLLRSCQGASVPALGTMLSQLPSHVVCARFAASGNQKLIWKIKLKDKEAMMFNRKLIFITLTPFSRSVARVCGWQLLESCFCTISPPQNLGSTSCVHLALYKWSILPWSLK